MIIDNILETTHKKSPWIWAVLSGISFFAAPLSLILAGRLIGRIDFGIIKRKKSNDNKRYLLWLFFWGVMIMLLGLGLLISGFVDHRTPIFYIWCACEVLAGLLLLSVGITYSETTIKLADDLIIYLYKNRSINTNVALASDNLKRKEQPQILVQYISEFKKYKIIELQQESDGIYKVMRFHPHVESWFESNGHTLHLDPQNCTSSTTPKSSSRVCSGCGAINESSDRCEYCNRVIIE